MQKRKKAHRGPRKALDRPVKKMLSRPKKTGQRTKPIKSLTRNTPLQNASLSLLEETHNSAKVKRGRRTTGDNLLLGSRNDWLSFFERCWHETGWSLVEIRKRRMNKIEEIRKIFEPLQGKPNYSRADCFLRGSPEPVEGNELRANRIKASKLHYEIQETESQRREMEFSRAHAESALTQADEQDREAIENEVKKRKGRLLELGENLRRAEIESNDLDRKVLDQETHWYCAQLLDFLCNGKYAVKPLALANALAGSPEMGWRQSLARCSKMPRSSIFVQYPYGVFEAISKIWERRFKDPQLTVIELFRAKIPQIRKKNAEAHSYLSEGWRDLRLAIEECSPAEHSDDFMPYAISRAFMKNRSRLKTQADLIMDEHEKLVT
ncbi:MAG: hypothetical protein ACYDCM_10580 [Candidatus Acidiferrales bacterium]